GSGSVLDGVQRVHDAVAEEPVPLLRAFTGLRRGPLLPLAARLGVPDVLHGPWARARLGCGGAPQDLLDAARAEREAAVAAVPVPVLADDERGDPDGVRRRHRRALDRLVVRAVVALAALDDVRHVRR